MNYTVKGAGRNRKVAFTCPTCGAAIESPLSDAGQNFPCPTCGRDFVTPGIPELEQSRREEAAQVAAQVRAQKIREHEAAERRARDAQEARDREEQLVKAAERAKTQTPLPQAQLARPPDRSISQAAFAVVLLLVVVAGYGAVVRTMQSKLDRLESRLNELTKTVDRNATDLESLRLTVNRNAGALNSLTDTVNYNADAANRNNRLR